MATSGNRTEDSTASFQLVSSAPRIRELTGAVDLLSYYGLRHLHERFCQKPLPVSVGESHYLNNVVGDIDIWKGDGMELQQLIGPDNENASVHIHQFDTDVLQQAFTLRESGPISLPEADCGFPTISGKVKEEYKEKDRKHKKHKKHKERHKDREKDKERYKDRDKEKDRDKDKQKNWEKDRSKKRENGDDQSKKHHRKKRKHDGDEEEGEAHRHKKKKQKHSSSKAEVPGQLMIR